MPEDISADNIFKSNESIECMEWIDSPPDET
jgi:hypothetical protein